VVKLKLSVEELRVESFHTAEPSEGRGTVRGAEAAGTNASGCIIASCGATCPLSCQPSCPDGCETFDDCQTNASGCIILTCGTTCPLSCDPSCPNGCDHD